MERGTQVAIGIPVCLAGALVGLFVTLKARNYRKRILKHRMSAYFKTDSDMLSSYTNRWLTRHALPLPISPQCRDITYARHQLQHVHMTSGFQFPSTGSPIMVSEYSIDVGIQPDYSTESGSIAADYSFLDNISGFPDYSFDGPEEQIELQNKRSENLGCNVDYVRAGFVERSLKYDAMNDWAHTDNREDTVHRDHSQHSNEMQFSSFAIPTPDYD